MNILKLNKRDSKAPALKAKINHLNRQLSNTSLPKKIRTMLQHDLDKITEEYQYLR